jgi:hypothetical protein
MTRVFKKEAERSASGGWTGRLTTWLVAVAALLMASTVPLGVGPQNERDKAKVADVAPAAYDAAPDVAAADTPEAVNAAADEQPSFLARFFRQLRSAMGGVMVGLAVALGQPPTDVFRDRPDDPCEIVPGEEIAEDVDYIYVDCGDGEDSA